MSDARAIEAVTETLRTLVDVGVKRVVTGARAITLPPNQIAASLEPRVNVFLYQADIDGSLRNTPPAATAAGETGRPALPLILHYLITPYAPDADDVQAHRLLGGALQALHSHPVLTHADLADAAAYSDIAHQLESVRICWQPLDDKDIHSLWSAFQAPYRISVAFDLRVVLIDSTAVGRAPLPVLKRGSDAHGPVVAASAAYPGPEITAVVPPGGQLTALPGEQVRVLGAGLAATVTVLLSHPVLPAPIEVPPDKNGVTDSQVTFTVPAGAPAGFGTVALSLKTSGPVNQRTNEAPLGIGPEITSPLPAKAAASARPVPLALTCAPQVHAGQNVVLLIGGTPVPAAPVAATTSDLTFTVGPLPAGTYPMRLRVDGADSRLIDRATTPPSYLAAQSVEVT
jgi:hypothetical protein